MDPYELILAELAKPQPVAPPAFSPDQQRSRVRDNNSVLNVALLGQLSQDERINSVGGQVFKKALADREERVTNRGTTDPLTGETAVDPEYADQQASNRRDSILKAALAFEDKRRQAEERGERDKEMRIFRLAMAGQRGGQDALKEARVDLVKAQTEATQARIDAAKEKEADAIAKKNLSIDRNVNRAKNIIAKTDEALKMVGPMTAGVGGTISRAIPGLSDMTGATNLEETANTIRANLGFAELEDMRQSSPTGGALGQVAIKEIEFLQAALASLNTRQTPAKLRENLNQIKTHYQNWLNAVEASRAGGAISTPPAPAQAAGGTAPAAPGASGVSRRYTRDASGKLVPAP